MSLPMITTRNCRNCFGEIGINGNIEHIYNCTCNKFDDMIHEIKCDGLTVIENNNNSYRYKCSNNCNLTYRPSVNKIKTCLNCLGTGGTSGNINHIYNCSNNKKENIKHTFNCNNKTTIIVKNKSGFYRYRCEEGCAIYYSE